jgi:hypothetical protein
MAKAKILTGARATVTVKGVPVGLFSNISWSIRQDKSPAFVLGAFGPVEITPTAQEPVSVSLSGYRIVDKGPYTLGATELEDLLLEEDFEIVITDRQSQKAIFTAQGCRLTGWSSGVSARGVSDIRMDALGLKGWDEAASSSSETKGSGADFF